MMWFRRDLRLHDHPALNAAIEAAFHDGDGQVVALFNIDAKVFDAAGTPLQAYQNASLKSLNESLNGNLLIRYGNPKEVLLEVVKASNAKSVHISEDFEPYGRLRDVEVEKELAKINVPLVRTGSPYAVAPFRVTKDDGTPYVVYTPYSKKWKDAFSKIKLSYYNSEEKLDKIINHSYPFLSLKDIGFELSSIKVTPYKISNKVISNYEETRNFPALNGTSMLGTHLRFGAVSIRKMVNHASTFQNETFLKELIWREFFMQILWHFPHTVNSSFRPKYDAIQWKNNEELFKQWCDGKTGYPIVDAGMRELNKTGHMHNRVRMIVASFLCKHLLIDWKWGETYFAQKLLDYEQASNVGNWQWAAGSGVDAAPYFRIFNPTEQVKKFDKDLKYIKKWVPELETIHYPKPIVDHKEARELCLKVYKEAVG